MYISSFHIDGFGIFADTEASGLAPGMVVFQGGNEAGKSTCLEFLRAMLFGYSNKKDGRRFLEPVAGARQGGSLVLQLPGQDSWPAEIRLSRRPGRGNSALALHDAAGNALNPAILEKILSGITGEVYRAVYGFSLSELENFACLNAEGVRNALYSASFGPGIEAPGKVMRALGERQAALYSTGRKNTEMRRILETLDGVNAAINELAQKTARFDAEAAELADTGTRLRQTRETRKNLEDERRNLERRQGVWRQWNEWRLLGMRLEAMALKAPGDFPEDAELRLLDMEKDRINLERQMAEAGEKIAGLEKQKNSLVIDLNLARALAPLRRLSERKMSYRQAAAQIPVDEESFRRCEGELVGTLSQLGPGWDCERIRKTNRSLFAREDLEKQAREMAAAASAHQACVDVLARANRDVDACRKAVQNARESLDAMPEPTAVMNGGERDELRQNMARLDESLRLGPVRERALEAARTSFMRAFEKLHFVPPRQLPDGVAPGELAEDVRRGEEAEMREENACALLDELLARQDDALALAGEMNGSMSARLEVEKALKQAQDEAEALRHKMDEMRRQLREKAGPGREALDARGAALRSLRALTGNMATEKERLQELDGRINAQAVPGSGKSVPLLTIGGLLLAAGAAILIAHWLLHINEFAITPNISWPVNLWSGYLVLACGVGFLAGGLPRSGPEARQYAMEMAQLQNRRETCALHLAELGDQARALCEKAEIDSADPITLDATEVLLEREREQCFHEEQAAREMGALQTELARIRTRESQLVAEAHAREQEAQQLRRRWHAMMQALHLATIPSPEGADTFFARAETARLAYAGVANAQNELNQVWSDMHDLEARISAMPQIAALLKESPVPLGLAEAVRQILESCREADAYRDQRIRAASNLQNGEAALVRAQTAQQEAAAELRTAEGRLGQSRSTWNHSVAVLGLGEDLNPETVREAFKCMESCLQLESRLKGIQVDLEKNRSELAALEQPLAEIMRGLGEKVEDGSDWTERLDTLLASAEAMEKAYNAASRLDFQIGREQDELRGLSARLATIGKQENALFSAAGATDADSFLRLAHAHVEEKDLRKNLQSLRDTLQLAAGHEPLEDFLDSFENSNEADLQKRLDEIDDELANVLEEEENLAARKAALDASVAAMRGSGELAALRREKASLLEKMENVAGEWSADALAGAILQQAKNVFERERQPEIVEIASRLFASITNGRWRGLNVSLEDSTLLVLPEHGEPVPPEYLSRGAQEQAYLALRLAYIMEHAKHAQTLPIIMDEILVNFDPERAKRAAKTFSTLVDGPQKQQLIYFTCQPAMAEMLAETSPGASFYMVENGTIRPA